MRKKLLSNQDFLSRVREYLPTEASIWETDADGNPQGSGLAGDLSESTFYIFDSEALMAICHAIEDLALDEANGTLISACQEFKHIEQHRERYWQLAATIDEVQVVGSGKTPRRNGKLKFCDGGDAVTKCWAVIYLGRRCQAMLLCEQSNDARVFDEKQFIGFYTFNRPLMERVRQEIGNVLDGRCPELREFRRLQTLDRAAKKLRIQFARETEAVEVAIQRLQHGGDHFTPETLVAELEKLIERLQEWKVRIPEMLAEQGT